MDTTQREVQSENCSLCGELPDELIVKTGQDQKFPPACYKLVPVGGKHTSQGSFSQDHRCPECGAYFVWEENPQMYGSGIADEERLIRVSADPLVRNRAYGLSRMEEDAAAAQRAAEVGAKRARHAFSIMEKHFASAGVAMKHNDPPKDWSDFCSLFYRNTDELLKKGLLHEKLLRGMLAELVAFVRAFSSQDYTENLYKLLMDFRRYNWLAPLLPDSERYKVSDLEELHSQYKSQNEDYDEQLRLGQMSY
jgi:hypothetical protein